MLKLSHPITSINGFKTGDKVRLKDGDGRPHIIKSFSIDGLKEFFFEVQFEDGTETMLNNISFLPSDIDEAAKESAERWRKNPDGSESRELFFQPHIRGFKAGVEWVTGQGFSKEETVWGIGKNETPAVFVADVMHLPRNLFKRGDKVIVQVRKKEE